MKLKGIYTTRQVFIDGKELLPDRSLDVRSHSPDGFLWGYEGSAPYQLALAILLEYTTPEKSLDCYGDFARNFIASLPIRSDFEENFDVEDWLKPKASLSFRP